MKKITLITFLITVLASSASFAQKAIGGHLGYGTEVESFALGVNAEIFVHEKISIAPNFTYYFPKKEEQSGNFGQGSYKSTQKFSFWELNIDGHYYFTEADASTAFYGLAGINVLGSKYTLTNKIDYPEGYWIPDSNESASDNDTEVGLNLGAGVNFNTGGVIPFAELKYETVGDGQLVIMAGLRFSIGR